MYGAAEDVNDGDDRAGVDICYVELEFLIQNFLYVPQTRGVFSITRWAVVS